jgi:siroheme decarboxylase
MLDHPDLAKAVQGGVPLEARPFLRIGESVGMAEQDVIDTLASWHSDGVLREISAVLEGEAFGWESALVAAAVAPERLEAVAAVVGAHPNVTHNYERNHRFNLWFTLAVPPEMGLHRTLNLLEEESGAGPFLPLPRTRTFKISVRMDPTTKRNRSHGHVKKGPIARVDTADEDRLKFRLLQTPMPFVPRPFEQLGAAHGLSEEQLIAFAEGHRGGAMRRYAATFHHRKLGVKGNVMSAWDVPPERIEEVGVALAELPEVSHCYAREVDAQFPFSLYAMIHGPDPSACAELAEATAERLGLPTPAMLQSTREFKKCRLRYFLPELTAWWQARVPDEGANERIDR